MAVKDAINLKIAIIMEQVFIHIPRGKIVAAVGSSTDNDVTDMLRDVYVAGDLNIKPSDWASVKATEETEVV